VGGQLAERIPGCDREDLQITGNRDRLKTLNRKLKVVLRVHSPIGGTRIGQLPKPRSSHGRTRIDTEKKGMEVESLLLDSSRTRFDGHLGLRPLFFRDDPWPLGFHLIQAAWNSQGVPGTTIERMPPRSLPRALWLETLDRFVFLKGDAQPCLAI
jgi:hypothetical protein